MNKKKQSEYYLFCKVICIVSPFLTFTPGEIDCDTTLPEP